MKTLTEINKGCGKQHNRQYNDGDRYIDDYMTCESENSLCPTCQALKEQMERIIEGLKDDLLELEGRIKGDRHKDSLNYYYAMGEVHRIKHLIDKLKGEKE